MAGPFSSCAAAVMAAGRASFERLVNATPKLPKSMSATEWNMMRILSFDVKCRRKVEKKQFAIRAEKLCAVE